MGCSVEPRMTLEPRWLSLHSLARMVGRGKGSSASDESSITCGTASAATTPGARSPCDDQDVDGAGEIPVHASRRRVKSSPVRFAGCALSTTIQRSFTSLRLTHSGRVVLKAYCANRSAPTRRCNLLSALSPSSHNSMCECCGIARKDSLKPQTFG